MVQHFISMVERCEGIFKLDDLHGYDTTRLFAYLAERYLSFGLKNIPIL